MQAIEDALAHGVKVTGCTIQLLEHGEADGGPIILHAAVPVLEGDRVVWRKVSIGISSYTKSQVLSGLAEGDAVALPTEKPIKSGSRVEATFQ